MKERNGLCGVNPFCTTEDDPFIKCCRKHDLAYDNLGPKDSTKEIDKQFLKCCLRVAKTDKPLQFRAKTYYRLARTYGMVREILGKLGLHKWGKM